MNKFKKIKKNRTVFGRIFVVAAALITYIMVFVVYYDKQAYERMINVLFDCGVDVMCAMIAAALYFGCMKQEGDWAKSFRMLNVCVSAGLAVNFLFWYTSGVPELRTFNLILVMISKLLDLGMIYHFYRYMERTLGFEGKLFNIAEKLIPILLILENLVILSNIFYPVTFQIDNAGIYKATSLSTLEDIYLIITSVITAILIIRSENPVSQKVAGMAFICLPLLNYVTVGGEFGNGSQYGMILVSLIIMYSIIFSAKSSELAATESELNMATQIQASMLPSIFPAFPQREEFDLYASMDPAKEVGGDFYDFFMIDDDHLGIVIADVSGKGVPAALFMMISKTIVQNFAMLGISAAEVLTRANNAICAQNKMKMFVTTWIGILQLSTGKMNCASAGHEYPAIYHDGRFELYKDKRKIALGAMKNRQYIDYEIQLFKDDKLFVYTDGVPEATNANDELFGNDRMIEALNIKPEVTPKEILATVRASVDEFVGNAVQFDDLTMVCLEYRGCS